MSNVIVLEPVYEKKKKKFVLGPSTMLELTI